MRLIILILFFIGIQLHSWGQHSDPAKDKMEWFQQGKLGIFIHWGIYAVNGIDESWSFFNEYISHEDYLKQSSGFTASNYDPVDWVTLIQESGAKYAVITARHHDGFALWDTQFGELNAPEHSSAKRDLLTPFVNSLRKAGLKVGLYYSLPDWSHLDYPNFTRRIKRYQSDTMRWNKYLRYYQGQLEELQTRYFPDLWWFDGDWEFGAEQWEAKKVRGKLLQANPLAIINSRLSGYGDYATPEQGLPIQKPKSEYWELCMTMNDSWGFQGNDRNYKTPYQIVRIFADVISMGGNLLLDIGPKADGTIPTEQMRILKELGRWTRKHQEAIYDTQAGLPPGYFYGPSTLSRDSTVLYLFLPHPPKDPIALKGIANQINRIRVVGEGTKLSHQLLMKPYWSEKPGIIYIDVPSSTIDEYMTVVAVQLQGKLKLARE